MQFVGCSNGTINKCVCIVIVANIIARDGDGRAIFLPREQVDLQLQLQSLKLTADGALGTRVCCDVQ